MIPSESAARDRRRAAPVNHPVYEECEGKHQVNAAAPLACCRRALRTMLDRRPRRWQFRWHDALAYAGSARLMTAADDFSAVPPFEIRASAEQRVPFVFNSPHSGRHYPERFLAMTRLDRNAIRRSEDCYVDELFGGAVALGAPMLAANFPRAYLDVNREPWELDPRMFAEPLPPFANIRSARVAGGLGTVPQAGRRGARHLSRRGCRSRRRIARIETIYKPYHDALKRLLTRTHARFGFAVLIDCHSMPASIRVGDSGRAARFHRRRPLRHLGRAGADRGGDRRC